jgi:hypothetical protein
VTSVPKDQSSVATYLASAHLQERREARHQARIEIEVSGIDPNGQMFQEQTVTTNVSEWGCGFMLSIELKPGDIVVVRVKATDQGEGPRQAMFQVMRAQHEESGWAVGAWKLKSGNIWGAQLEKLGKPEESSPSARKAGTDDFGNRRRDPGQ